MSGLTGNGASTQAQALKEPDVPALAVDAVKSYYTGSAPIRSFRQYLDGVDKKQIMSDLLKDAASDSHAQSTEPPPTLESTDDNLAPLPPVKTQPDPPSAARVKLRASLIESLLGS